MMTAGRAMAEAILRRPFTTEARVLFQATLRGLPGGQSGAGTGFSPSTRVCACHCHSTDS